MNVNGLIKFFIPHSISAIQGKTFLSPLNTRCDIMKAVVLGGAGVMGSYAVERLSKSAVFSEIMVADIDEERARKIRRRAKSWDTRRWMPQTRKTFRG